VGETALLPVRRGVGEGGEREDKEGGDEAGEVHGG
jgi:hypothetical protein